MEWERITPNDLNIMSLKATKRSNAQLLLMFTMVKVVAKENGKISGRFMTMFALHIPSMNTYVPIKIALWYSWIGSKRKNIQIKRVIQALTRLPTWLNENMIDAQKAETTGHDSLLLCTVLVVKLLYYDDVMCTVLVKLLYYDDVMVKSIVDPCEDENEHLQGDDDISLGEDAEQRDNSSDSEREGLITQLALINTDVV